MQHPFAVVSSQGPTCLLLEEDFVSDRNGCCAPKTPMRCPLIVLRYSFKVLPAVSVVMVGEAMEARTTWQYWTDYNDHMAVLDRLHCYRLQCV